MDFVTGGKGKLKIVANDDATLHAREELETVGTCGWNNTRQKVTRFLLYARPVLGC